MDPHLSVEDIAAIVDGNLPADRRAAAEAHLVACSECRSELMSASELADSAPARSRISGRWLAIAAAAVVVLTVFPLLRNRSMTDSTSAQRSTLNGTAIQPLWPMNGAKAPIDSLTFSWRAVPGAMGYHLFITDSTGAPVYDRTTTDTVVAPLHDAHVSAGARYFWYVDALRDDGSSVASRQIGFFIRDR